MGYRSQICIVVSEEFKKKLIEFIEEIGIPDKEKYGDDHYAVYFESIKWPGYPAEEIDDLMLWLGTLEDDEYGFIDIGEDLSDITIKGNPWKYEIYVSRGIDTEWTNE